MSVSAISSNNGLAATAWQSPAQQIKQDLGALGQALQSGDLSGAQAAFATLQQDLPAGAGGSSAASPLAPVGQALQSGNLGTAQTAFAALQHGHKGHRHHHGGADAATSAPPSTTSVTTAGGGLPGSVLNASA